MPTDSSQPRAEVTAAGNAAVILETGTHVTILAEEYWLDPMQDIEREV